MIGAAAAEVMTCDWIRPGASASRLSARYKMTCHVASHLCRRHCRKVRRSGVVLATANDGYTAQLAFHVLGQQLRSSFSSPWHPPLWKWLSMGGTNFRALARSAWCDSPSSDDDIFERILRATVRLGIRGERLLSCSNVGVERGVTTSCKESSHH
jgi:hypothetical protein